METVSLSPERKGQLEEYAKRHGQDISTALDDVLSDYLAWERQDYSETVAAVNEAYEDVRAGRTRPSDDFFTEVRLKYGFSR